MSGCNKGRYFWTTVLPDNTDPVIVAHNTVRAGGFFIAIATMCHVWGRSHFASGSIAGVGLALLIGGLDLFDVTMRPKNIESLPSSSL